MPPGLLHGPKLMHNGALGVIQSKKVMRQMIKVKLLGKTREDQAAEGTSTDDDASPTITVAPGNVRAPRSTKHFSKEGARLSAIDFLLQAPEGVFRLTTALLKDTSQKLEVASPACNHLYHATCLARWHALDPPCACPSCRDPHAPRRS